MAQQASLQQLNIQHFNKHHLDPKQHMLTLADKTVAHFTTQLPLDKDQVVLEFGCGTGLIAERLSPHVDRVYGIDIAPNAVQAFNAKAAAQGIANMSAVCLDILQDSDVQQALECGALPSKFDFVCGHMVLHHVEDAAAVVAALGQRLQAEPPGQLVLTDLFATARSKRFHGGHAHHTVSHPGGFSEEQIRQLMQSAGLQLSYFDTTSVVVTKAVQQPNGGGDVTEDFPIFVAVGQRVAN